MHFPLNIWGAQDMGTVKAPMPQVSDGKQSRLLEGFQPDEFLGGFSPYIFAFL